MTIVWKRKHIRSSRLKLVGIRVVLKFFCIILRKTPVPESLFDEVGDLKACIYTKKRLWNRCSLVIFTEFLCKPFFTELIQWLFLKTSWLLLKIESCLILIYVLTKFACFQGNMNLISSNKRIHLQIWFQTVGLYWEARSYCNDFWVKLARGKVIFSWRRKGAICREKMFPLFRQLNGIIEIALFLPDLSQAFPVFYFRYCIIFSSS